MNQIVPAGQREELIRRALEARQNAYAPYSHFKVGASLLCKDGSIFTGCNVENQSYPAGVCAERAALGAAVSAGHRCFLAIAVAGGETPITPCGICRQALSEFGDMAVFCAAADGTVRAFTLGQLLPESFCLAEASRGDR